MSCSGSSKSAGRAARSVEFSPGTASPDCRASHCLCSRARLAGLPERPLLAFLGVTVRPFAFLPRPIPAIPGIPGIPGFSTAQAATKPHKSTLDQADFLALMSAQLKNQDPTKPVDNSEYVAQMAQFSTVNGIATTNSAIAQSNATLAAIAAKLDALIAATKD